MSVLCNCLACGVQLNSRPERRSRPGRRGFLRAAGSGVVATGLLATGLSAAAPAAFASDGSSYQAMLLSCIDPRLVEPMHDFMAHRGLAGQYSHFSFAGAAIGVEAKDFDDWHKTFWDNLAASKRLHKIHALIVIDHRDCGAAKIAFGPEIVGDAARETEAHRGVLQRVHTEIATRQLDLDMDGYLMALDGSVQKLV